MKSQTYSRPLSPSPSALAAGMFVGAGLAIWLAPRVASELRERITGSAKHIGQRASGHYEHARNRFGEAVDALTSTARALADCPPSGGGQPQAACAIGHTRPPRFRPTILTSAARLPRTSESSLRVVNPEGSVR